MELTQNISKLESHYSGSMWIGKFIHSLPGVTQMFVLQIHASIPGRIMPLCFSWVYESGGHTRYVCCTRVQSPTSTEATTSKYLTNHDIY
jgi:hypothetical protein